MQGNILIGEIGGLSVTAGTSDNLSVVWSRLGNQGSQWQDAAIDIAAQTSNLVVSFYHFITIDIASSFSSCD